jgi:ubiquinol-cytochrome c reductase cytochrome c subunit
MKHLPSILALALLCGAGAARAQATADEVERGRQLYMANGCFSCHGTVGQGGERSGAPKLAPGPHPFEAFKVLVREPREAMPRLDPRYVSDEQLLSIHRYLASIAKGPSAKEIPALQPSER